MNENIKNKIKTTVIIILSLILVAVGIGPKLIFSHHGAVCFPQPLQAIRLPLK